jgi:hypothetical protein
MAKLDEDNGETFELSGTAWEYGRKASETIPRLCSEATEP